MKRIWIEEPGPLHLTKACAYCATPMEALRCVDKRKVDRIFFCPGCKRIFKRVVR